MTEQLVDVTCPACGFQWQEDIAWHRDNDSIHANPRQTTRPGSFEVYRFRCPQDGTWVTVEIPTHDSASREE